jgi:hypothetical protein
MATKRYLQLPKEKEFVYFFLNNNISAKKMDRQVIAKAILNSEIVNGCLYTKA